MLLFPSKTKFKKHKKFKGKLKRSDFVKTLPSNEFFFGLKLLKTNRISFNQIEAARRVIRKKIKKKFLDQILINNPMDISVTKKSSGVRMGRGKGNFHFWTSIIKSGRVVFEFNQRIPFSMLKRDLTSAGCKISSASPRASSCAGR